jgi:dienelactone hydrolase
MRVPLSADIADFTRHDMTFDGRTKPVLVSGAGPAVIVMHEIFGFTPTLARLCRWIRDAGFCVYAPILFGTPDATNAEDITLARTVWICISREFAVLASNRTSPVVSWLRQLARAAHAACGGCGVGAIGLCATGGFALAMAVDPVIQAPVLGEPSLPALAHGALDLSPGMMVRGYRFEGDTLCRAPRFATLRREFGDAFAGTELPDDCANPEGMRKRGKPPHSVFTLDLIDAPGERTRAAVDEVIGFFRERL